MNNSAFAPGLYLGLSNDAYHADGAVGSTGIKRLVKNPPNYWVYSGMNPDRPIDEETIATKFGSAYHQLILEPDKFAYKKKPGVKSTTVENMLGEGEWNALMEMKRVLLSHPDRATLITGGLSEVSFFWVDEETGITCKIRVDHFTPHAFTDLKSTTDVADSNLRYEIPKRGWDVSGAMYCEGARMLKQMTVEGYAWPSAFSQEFISKFMGNEGQLFAFMTQEKDAPHEVRTLMLTPPVAAIGLVKFREGLHAYQECHASHGAMRWPSKHPVIENMEIENLSASINY